MSVCGPSGWFWLPGRGSYIHQVKLQELHERQRQTVCVKSSELSVSISQLLVAVANARDSNLFWLMVVEVPVCGQADSLLTGLWEGRLGQAHLVHVVEQMSLTSQARRCRRRVESPRLLRACPH